MKSLVVFYSLTGKTRLAAQAIGESLDAEIAEIEEAQARRTGFPVYLAGGFAAIMNKGSKIKPITVDIDQYDRVFVGSPVWASRPTPAINSFIYGTNLEGRTVIPFVTLGGESSRAPLANMTAKIQKRGGTVPGSFAVTTNQVSDKEIATRVRDAVSRLSK
ncbi:MAG: flavodoxin family protein [Dehalococcoidia bacterium]